MQIRFRLGPAGSGKTFRCLREIREALIQSPEGPPLIFLAPKQATFELERQLLSDPQLGGYTRLQILSFERLAAYVLSEFSTPPRLLDEDGRLMVLRALLAQRQNELRIFRATARMPGFARQLSLFLRECQRRQLLDRKLAALSDRGDLPKTLRDKLHDFALLLGGYLDWLKRHDLQDANRLLDLATEALGKPDARGKLRFAALWLDGFAEMTPQELDFLGAVAPLCGRVTLAFCLDRDPPENESWLSTWTTVGRAFNACRRRLASIPGGEVTMEILPRGAPNNRFAGNPALAHLETHWNHPQPMADSGARPGSKPGEALPIRLTACADAEAEAVVAAREILRHVRGGGRFRECAVLLRSLEGHHDSLSRVFRRYDIPFFLDRREPMAHHPLAELTRFALRTAAFGWQHEDWFGALKTGLVSRDNEGIDALENAALARGWKGSAWRQPLNLGGDANLEQRLERLRKEIAPSFQRLSAQLAQAQTPPTGLVLAEALRRFWEELDVARTLEDWKEEKHLTIWEQMQSWLDNIELAFPSEAMPLSEWLPIVESGLANLSVGLIPPRIDQALIGAVDRSRNPDLKVALILGVNESAFPATPKDDALLTETERKALESAGVSPGPDRLAQLGHEGYYGYIAFTRASRRIVATCARRDARDRPMNPSPFFGRLKRLFPGIEIEEDAPPASLMESEHIRELAGQCLDKEHGAFLRELAAAGPLRERWQTLAGYSPDSALSPELAERLYGPVLRASVSRIEQFAACPFRFFIHSGLRADERKLFEADARERGSFQHEVLRAFHDELRSQDRKWRDVSPAEARDLIGRIASRIAIEFREGLFAASAESAFAARGLAAALQDYMETAVGWFEDYSFDPRAVELSFGEENDELPAWELDLGHGHRMAFRGKIDRVDLEMSPSNGQARFVVMDYKSGGKKIDPLLMENGAQIQLPAYLAALRQAEAARKIFGVNRLIPVGAFYVNLRGDYPPAKHRGEVLDGVAETRRRAYRHAGRFNMEALPELDRGAPGRPSGQFNYKITAKGKPDKRYPDLLEAGDFNALLNQVESSLRKMGQRIYTGEAGIDPYRKGSETACDHCVCKAICRIDPWEHHFRVLKKTPIGKDAP